MADFEKIQDFVEEKKEEVMENLETETPKGKVKKLVIGGAFAAGAAAGALTTEVIIPGAKKLGRWIGSKFNKDKKSEDKPEESEEKEETKDDSEETTDEKKPETSKKHKKKR